MPVLIIAVVFLLLFLIMGAMSVSAVLSERRFDRQPPELRTPDSSKPSATARRAGA